MSIKRKQDGFTVIELMIATAIFSVILLVCTMGLIYVGRLYYKGITSSRTQEAARVIMDDVTQSIQFGGGGVGVDSDATGGLARCFGGKRYSYVLGQQLVDSGAPDSSKSEVNHVIVADQLSTCNGVTAKDIGNVILPAPEGKELMGTHMRLTTFDVQETSPGSSLYRVTIRVVYGDDDVLNPAKTGCANSAAGSHFCAASELTTIVQKRVE